MKKLLIGLTLLVSTLSFAGEVTQENNSDIEPTYAKYCANLFEEAGLGADLYVYDGNDSNYRYEESFNSSSGGLIGNGTIHYTAGVRYFEEDGAPHLEKDERLKSIFNNRVDSSSVRLKGTSEDKAYLKERYIEASKGDRCFRLLEIQHEIEIEDNISFRYEELLN
jgi:hypothetical protein